VETIDSAGDTMSVHTVEPRATELLRSKYTPRFPAPLERHGISLVRAVPEALRHIGKPAVTGATNQDPTVTHS
jgi:hypothetical protein